MPPVVRLILPTDLSNQSVAAHAANADQVSEISSDVRTPISERTQQPSTPPPATSSRDTSLLKLFHNDYLPAMEAARNAETLDAYNTGVEKTLQSMADFWKSWIQRGDISLAEKRILRREMERLLVLVAEGKAESARSARAFADRKAEEHRAEEALEAAIMKISARSEARNTRVKGKKAARRRKRAVKVNSGTRGPVTNNGGKSIVHDSEGEWEDEED